MVRNRIIKPTTMCQGSGDPLYVIVSYYTVFPKSSDPFYELTYYMKWVPTFWTYSTTVCFRSSDPFIVNY